MFGTSIPLSAELFRSADLSSTLFLCSEERYLLAEAQDEMLDLHKHKEERNDGATFNLAL